MVQFRNIDINNIKYSGENVVNIEFTRRVIKQCLKGATTGYILPIGYSVLLP